MLLRRAILLVLLALGPCAFARHINRSTDEETTEKQTDSRSASGSASKRQLRRTHLRLHGKPPKTLHAQEGGSEFLECQAGGTPAPAIHWLRDGVALQQTEVQAGDRGNGSRRRINVSFTASRLFLDCLSPEDAGEYSCVAENPFQRTSASTRLLVSPSPAQEEEQEDGCENRAHGLAPRFVQWTRTMLGSQGQPARLTCRAQGYPRPTIRWLGANDEELTGADFSQYQILPEGDLLIGAMGWDDMGTFTCIAENVHGEAKVEVFLYPAIPDK